MKLLFYIFLLFLLGLLGDSKHQFKTRRCYNEEKDKSKKH